MPEKLKKKPEWETGGKAEPSLPFQKQAKDIITVREYAPDPLKSRVKGTPDFASAANKAFENMEKERAANEQLNKQLKKRALK